MFQYQARKDQGNILFYGGRTDVDREYLRLLVCVRNAIRALLGVATWQVFTAQDKTYLKSKVARLLPEKGGGYTDDKQRISQIISTSVKFFDSTASAETVATRLSSKQIVSQLLEQQTMEEHRQSVLNHLNDCLVTYVKTDDAVQKVRDLDKDAKTTCMAKFQTGLQAILLEVGGEQNQLPSETVLAGFIAEHWPILKKHLKAAAQRFTPPERSQDCKEATRAKGQGMPL